MLNLERLRVLRAIAVTGSVRGAAETLHVTTSAVSQQIDRLEREVGQPLVERQGRGVRLTDAGSVLAAHAGDLLASVERVEADLAERAGAVVGRVTVASFATAARGLLPAALRSLRAYERLSVRLTELEPTDSLPLLARGEVDVAVVQDWAESPLTLPEGVSSRPLLDDVLDAALPASHPLAAKESVGLADLASSDWVTWTSGQICNSWIEQSLRSEGVQPELVHTASEHSTQLALVAAGVGVAIIPRLGRDPVPDTVRMVPTSPALERRVFATWRTTSTRRPAIRAVLDALNAAAAEAVGIHRRSLRDPNDGHFSSRDRPHGM